MYLLEGSHAVSLEHFSAQLSDFIGNVFQYNHVSVSLEGRNDYEIIALILPNSQENGSITLLDKNLDDTWQKKNDISVEKTASSLNFTAICRPKQAIPIRSDYNLGENNQLHWIGKRGWQVRRKEYDVCFF